MTGHFHILTSRRPDAVPDAATIAADVEAAVLASRDWPPGLDPLEIVARLMALDAEPAPDKPEIKAP